MWKWMQELQLCRSTLLFLTVCCTVVRTEQHKWTMRLLTVNVPVLCDVNKCCFIGSYCVIFITLSLAKHSTR